MFDWLWKLLGKRAGEDMEWDQYKPKDRKIYRYFDGTKEVAGDPMVLYKRFMDVAPEMRVYWKVSRSPSKYATKAHCDLIVKIRQVFEIKTLAEGGLSEPECEDLLDHFLIYVELVKKNSGMQAISVSETSRATPPSSAENPATPNGSASGSTAEEPKTESPGASPTAASLPSAP
jgi:hypothetical protein